jgi:hypothetical protein
VIVYILFFELKLSMLFSIETYSFFLAMLSAT